MVTDKYETRAAAWTRESFLEALVASSDRAWATRLFELLDSLPGSYCWCGKRPGGGILLHPWGRYFAPISLSINDFDELMVAGEWSKWSNKHDEGYAELAAYMSQDHRKSAPAVRASEFDVDQLWAVVQRCAKSINGGGAFPEADGVRVEEVPTANPGDAAREARQIEHLVAEPVIFAESELCIRFERHLRACGRKVRRYRIHLPGASYIESDLADVTANILYEAKGTADRMSVRLALGQVLDYAFHVKRINEEVRASVLLPGRPAPDLVKLLEAYRVGCVVELASGTFVDLTGLDCCP